MSVDVCVLVSVAVIVAVVTIVRVVVRVRVCVVVTVTVRSVRRRGAWVDRHERAGAPAIQSVKDPVCEVAGGRAVT